MNRNGDRTDPCGAPVFLTTTSDRELPSHTNWGLSDIVCNLGDKRCTGTLPGQLLTQSKWLDGIKGTGNIKNT